MISGLLEKSRELDNLRLKQEDVMLDNNRIHKKLQTGKIREPPFLFSVHIQLIYVFDSFLCLKYMIQGLVRLNQVWFLL